jgi:hypothetical protein
MDRNLWKLLGIFTFVLVFGGWQGLYNVGIGVLFITGLVVVILITFFKWDLILAGLKFLSSFFRKGRRM